VDHLNEGGCSGPFKVKSYTPGKQLTLVPNPYWWGRKLTLTEVDRPFLASKDTEYNNYDKLGDYDYTDVPGDAYVFAVGQSDFHQVPSLTTQYFGLNFNVPPFTDERIRQAFALALNKQLLVDRIYDGGAIPTNHIVPEGMPGYDERLAGPDGTESVTGNQQKALSLLHETQQECQADGDTQSYCPYIDDGTSSKAIYLVAGASSDATQKQIALIATQTWSQVLGLTVVVKDVVDLNHVEGVISPQSGPQANPAQIWQIGWLADYPDPEDFLSLQFHTRSGIDFSNVQDAQLDALMDKADADLYSSRRTAEYITIEQDVVNMVPWIPYAQLKWPWRVRPWVQGFGLNELLIMEDVDWSNVSILAH
jgi:peptide/nickel transport system substrate-binding protein/oligopeptide transport system substrate-binding protein